MENGEAGGADGSLEPMVRHLCALTKEIAEAQRTLGKLSAERDALRREVGELQATPPLLTDGQGESLRLGKEARLEARAVKLAERAIVAEPVPTPKEIRLEAKAAKQAERGIVDEPVPTPEELRTRAQAVGRRRRMIALSVIGAIGLTIVVWRLMGWASPVSDASKRGLTGIAYIGPFMNIVIGGFLIYRIVRVGSKAGNWLFPSAEEPRRRRR